MQGLADGYFIVPYTIGNYFATAKTPKPRADDPAFKQAVADAVVEYLAPVRERYRELRADEPALERILAAGAEKAHTIAAGTLEEVRQAMGVGRVRPPQ